MGTLFLLPLKKKIRIDKTALKVTQTHLKYYFLSLGII